MSSKLTIHGPNLNDQTKGTFHVHTADCRDNDREVKNNGSVEPITIDAESIDDVVDYIYDDQFNEQPDRREPDSYEHYVADFHFAPCVKLNRRDGSAAPASTTPRKRERLQLPKGTTPAKLVLQFVTERSTSAPDAGGQQRPFITHTNKLVIHAQWFRAWLAETLKTDVTTSQAVQILRDDLKFADRSVAVIGAPTKNLSVWMLDAPRTMKSIERQAAPERKTREPAAAPEPAKPAAKSTTRKRASSKSKSKSTSTATSSK
jgi:hypothetical protein